MLVLQGIVRYMTAAGPVHTTALRRGTLEFAVLAVLADGERYGLEITRQLSRTFGQTMSEGTVYPLLSRLRRAGSVGSSWRESANGPPRRYYSLTPAGHASLDRFKVEWVEFRSAIDQMMGTDRHEQE
jgi:PadR family transcriptional regulator PadR